MVEGAEKTDINKKKPNKALQVISNILFVLFMLVMVFFIFAAAQSKLTGAEPSILGHRLYIVESGSMEPAIKMGSMIIVKELPASQIKIEDMVIFNGNEKDERVTHRVVDIENNGQSFITRGDANNMDDPYPRDASKVIGKIIFSVPFIGFIFHYLSNPIAIGVIIILGGAWLLLPKILEKTED